MAVLVFPHLGAGQLVGQPAVVAPGVLGLLGLAVVAPGQLLQRRQHLGDLGPRRAVLGPQRCQLPARRLAPAPRCRQHLTGGQGAWGSQGGTGVRAGHPEESWGQSGAPRGVKGAWGAPRAVQRSGGSIQRGQRGHRGHSSQRGAPRGAQWSEWGT